MRGEYVPFNDGHGIVGYHYRCPECGCETPFADCEEGCGECDFSEPYEDPDDWHDKLIERRDIMRKMAMSLAKARADMDMTQSELAAKAGLELEQVQSMEEADKSVSLEWLVKAAQALGLTVSVNLVRMEAEDGGQAITAAWKEMMENAGGAE